MAITVTSPQPATVGFIKNGVSADASGGETLLAAVAGKNHLVRHVTLSNLTAGALSFTISDGTTAQLGALSIPAGATLQWDFNPAIDFGTNKPVKLTAAAGNVCAMIQGTTI